MTAQLQSPRLILRHWEDRDRAPYAELATDPVVMEFLSSPARPETPDQWIDRQRARFANDGFAYWAVEARDTGQFVGAVGLSRTNYEAHFTPAVGVGWRLCRQYLGPRLRQRSGGGGDAIRLRGLAAGGDRCRHGAGEHQVATGDAPVGDDVFSVR